MSAPISCDQLAGRFEGLGDNCELGLVQRCCGAEPLGLFRFSGAGLENLIHVISTGGSHLFTSDDVILSYNEGAAEYFVKSKYYEDFLSHTRLTQRVSDEEGLRQKRVKALTYLKDRFFEEMVRSDKIYVRKGAEGIVDMRRLHEALNRIGRNTLLWVVETDRLHEAGTIEKLGEGLWRGYVQRFKRFTLDEPIDLASWISVLREMHRADRPRSLLETSRCLASGRVRDFDRHLCAEIEPVNADPSLRLALLSDSRREQILVSAEVDLGIHSAGIIVASVQIKIEHPFRGERLDAHFADVPVLHSRPADLGQRGAWQTIWVAADLPPGRGIGTLGIKGAAGQGSVLCVGDWIVETGPVPSSDNRQPAKGARGRLARLFRLARRAGARYPKGSDVLQRSAIAMAGGRFIEADDMLSDALADKPGEPALLKQFAFSAHNSARYGTAIIRWQKALAGAPHDPMCHAGVAANFREFGEIGVAANVIGVALARFPDDGTVLTEAARIASKRRQFDEALALLERAIELFGPSPHLISGRDEAIAEVDAARRRTSAVAQV